MHIFHKFKSLLAGLCAAAAVVYCLAVFSQQSSAAGARPPRGRPGTVLVVPALPNIIKLAHEVSGMRAITMVAFRGRPGHSDLSLYVWDGQVWKPVAMNDFLALKFINSPPERIVVIGGDDVVPWRLSHIKSTAYEIRRIKSVQTPEVLGGLDSVLRFAPHEREQLARACGLSSGRASASRPAPAAREPSPAAVERRPAPAVPAPAKPHTVEKNVAFPETPVAAAVAAPEAAEQKQPVEHSRPVQVEPAPQAASRPSPAPSVEGEEIRLDLGDGAEMVFIRIPALGIWVGRDEVTNAQYERFDRAHDPKKYYDHALNLPGQPAVMVSWEDAVNYCAWLNRNFHGQIPAGHECRLPAESEWMGFALCGRQREYPWGNEWPPPASCNYKGTEGASMFYSIFHNENFIRGHDDGFIVAAPVAESGVNEWGLRGVGGNVWEWCQDLYENGRTERVLKGAAWNNSESAFMSITNRSAALPDKSNAMIGFRVVIAPQGK